MPTRMGEELTEPGGGVRLYVEASLGAGLRVEAGEGQAHYLVNVMRAKAGDRLSLFNGRDGEWRARIVEAKKRNCVLECEALSAPQRGVPDIWLVFAPIKKTPADYVVQKATELGARVLQPVLTRRTIARRVNHERMRANAVEAAEQCGVLSLPEVDEPAVLSRLLAEWGAGRRLVFCDEGAETADPIAALSGLPRSPLAILIGPEGGFAEDERTALLKLPNVVRLALGPRILRADTAAVAALALVQAVLGDWARPSANA
jgi:16S rRNA (uracil1498-N3)-methyltransferase